MADSLTESVFIKDSGLSHKHESFTINGDNSVKVCFRVNF